MNELSVIVCTSGEGKYLKKTLESLINQNFDKKKFEIIVVLNNASHKTKDFLTVFSQKSGLPQIIIVEERNQGLGFARNKGVDTSSGKYIAFIDDDAYASKNWLKKAYELIKKEEILAVGGKIIPVFDAKKPDWFKEEYETRSWGESERYLKPPETFSGSNMLIKKNILLKMGGFSVKTGMSDYLSLGEETAFFDRVWMSRGKRNILFYSPQLVVFHNVPSFKMNPFYQLKRSFAAGADRQRNGSVSLLVKPVLLLFYFFSLILAILSALFQAIKFRQAENWLVEKFAMPFYIAGHIIGLLGLPVRIRRNSD